MLQGIKQKCRRLYLEVRLILFCIYQSALYENKEQILVKIKFLTKEIGQLTTDRQNDIDKFGGICSEANQDYFHDISYKTAEIESLRWVLKI